MPKMKWLDLLHTKQFDLRQNAGDLRPAEDFFDPFANAQAGRWPTLPAEPLSCGVVAGLAGLAHGSVDRDMRPDGRVTKVMIDAKSGDLMGPARDKGGSD